ncbi:MAG: hypothetical protein WAT65_01370, partial [Candidatus Nanopelagicales bacterium]
MITATRLDDLEPYNRATMLRPLTDRPITREVIGLVERRVRAELGSMTVDEVAETAPEIAGAGAPLALPAPTSPRHTT